MKRLIVCCDGTWQNLEKDYPTNVVKLAQAILPTAGNKGDTVQILFYDEGVGTGAYTDTEKNDPFGKLINSADSFFGGAFGWGLNKNIKEAYRFLCFNYEPGDEIYLFGFSRGSYTVRSLAGFIYCSGLLKRQHLRQVPRAFDIYRSKEIAPRDLEADNFRDQYGHHVIGNHVPIKVLGCWDTVGSLGIPDLLPWLPLDQWLNKRYKFHDTVLSRIIENAFHAVAIDEPRKTFDFTPMDSSTNAPDQVLKQVWFPGDHGSVGGGLAETRGLSDGALQWMIDEVKQLGLEFDTNRILDPDGKFGIHEDPLVRFDSRPKGIFKLAALFSGGHQRNIRKHITGIFEEDVHQSVKQRWHYLQDDYRPRNLAQVYGSELNFWTP